MTSVDETGVDAGDSANAPLQTDVHYGIRMRLATRARRATAPTPAPARTSRSTTPTTTTSRTIPYWPGGLFGPATSSPSPRSGSPSSPRALLALTRTLTVEFTAAHSNLGGRVRSARGAGRARSHSTSTRLGPDSGRELVRHRDTDRDGPSRRFAVRVPAEARRRGAADDRDPGDTGTLVDYIAFCKGAS